MDFNKDLTSSIPKQQTVKNTVTPAKVFTLDDPLLRLTGRGASLHLS